MSKQHDYKYRALIEDLTDDPALLEAARWIDRKCLTEQGASDKEAAEIVAGSRTFEPSRVSSGELVRVLAGAVERAMSRFNTVNDTRHQMPGGAVMIMMECLLKELRACAGEHPNEMVSDSGRKT